jgi:hypothetical protein
MRFKINQQDLIILKHRKLKEHHFMEVFKIINLMYSIDNLILV